MAIQVPKMPSPLPALLLPSFGYRSCPAVLDHPFLGTVASTDRYWILTLWLLAFWPFLTLILENLVMRFSSRA